MIKKEGLTMFCSKCGRRLEEGQSVCPVCGTAQEPGPVTTNIMAVVGFVLGLISIFIDFFGIIGIIAIVLSVAGYMGCTQHNQKGKGRAIAGIILGLIAAIYAFFNIYALSNM